jgi:hypothetical protein
MNTSIILSNLLKVNTMLILSPLETQEVGFKLYSTFILERHVVSVILIKIIYIQLYILF